MTVETCMECGGTFEVPRPLKRKTVCSDLCRLAVKRRTRNRSDYLRRNPPSPGVCAVCGVTRLSASNGGLCCRPCWASLTVAQREEWENRLGREAVRV